MADNILDSKEHVLVIGGGIFGLSSAIVLAENGYRVTLVEKKYDVMLGASLVNQNRIHFGYHYPRSKATAEESLQGLASFKEYFGESIYGAFDKYYAVARRGSHVNAEEFAAFCSNVGLDLKEAWPEKHVLNKDMIEACWLTPEPVFDFHKMKQIAIYRLAKNRNVRVIRNTEPLTTNRLSDDSFEVQLTNGYKLHVDYILNTTYSGIPDFVEKNKFKPIKGKFQLCVMPILESSKNVDSPYGVTVMDGPFCSLMPKGFNKNHFILYHVVHSVIQQHVGYHSVDWSPIDGFVELDIMEQSRMFFPVLDEMKLRDSWITTRIVLPDQELDDARPTFMLEHEDRVFSIFSGKLTTCVDAGRKVLDYLKNKNS